MDRQVRARRNGSWYATRMHSFRARIERGRIIVHEPLDLPDGIVYLVVKEEANGDVEPAPARIEAERKAVVSAPGGE
jgi:hypothetical protein